MLATLTNTTFTVKALVEKVEMLEKEVIKLKQQLFATNPNANNNNDLPSSQPPSQEFSQFIWQIPLAYDHNLGRKLATIAVFGMRGGENNRVHSFVFRYAGKPPDTELRNVKTKLNAVHCHWVEAVLQAVIKFTPKAKEFNRSEDQQPLYNKICAYLTQNNLEEFAKYSMRYLEPEEQEELVQPICKQIGIAPSAVPSCFWVFLALALAKVPSSDDVNTAAKRAEWYGVFNGVSRGFVIAPPPEIVKWLI